MSNTDLDLDDLETYASPHGTLVRLADVKCRVARRASPQPVAPSAQIADDHAGDGFPLTDAELSDPEYVRGYIEGCMETVATTHAENRRLRALVSAQHPSVPVQEQSDKVDERAKFDKWAGIEYRHASHYTALEHDIGWAAWQASARQPCPPVQAGAPVSKFTRLMSGTNDYCLGWNDCVDEFHRRTPIPAHPAQDGEDARDALTKLRAEIRESQNHLETFGYAEEAARIALDGVLDTIDEHIADLDATQQGGSNG